MPSINILSVTLASGANDVTLATLTAADTDSLCILSLDRTVAVGLNAISGAAITVKVIQDGTVIAESEAVGGSSAPVTAVTVPLWPGVSRQVKATINVTGLTVAVSGSLTTQ